MELLSTETKTAEIKTPIRSRLETSTFSVTTSFALKVRSPNANLIISKICCLERLTTLLRTPGRGFSLPASANSEMSCAHRRPARPLYLTLDGLPDTGHIALLSYRFYLAG